MNGYICFYRDIRLEIYADTPYAAQQQVVDLMQKRFPRRKIKSWDVSVTLAEKNGQPVTHSTASL